MEIKLQTDKYESLKTQKLSEKLDVSSIKLFKQKGEGKMI
jgi:hypothetical protein